MRRGHEIEVLFGMAGDVAADERTEGEHGKVFCARCVERGAHQPPTQTLALKARVD